MTTTYGAPCALRRRLKEDSPKIPGAVRTADNKVFLGFDAAIGLANAPLKTVEALIAGNWEGRHALALARTMHDIQLEDTDAVIASIDKEKAVSWLKANRPDVVCL